MKKIFGLMLMLGLSMNTTAVMADDDDDDNQACPVGLVSGQTIDQEFGTGINAITRCVENRKKIKVVMQVNQACRDTSIVDGALRNHADKCGTSRGYGIAQMRNMILDWVVTHGIPVDKLDLNIIVHGPGATMLLKNPTDLVTGEETARTNNLEEKVEELIGGNVPRAEGAKVKFHFCMNTVRGMAKKAAIAKFGATATAEQIGMMKKGIVKKVIPGVTYVTGGLTALADFEKEGYMYIQP